MWRRAKNPCDRPRHDHHHLPDIWQRRHHVHARYAHSRFRSHPRPCQSLLSLGLFDLSSSAALHTVTGPTDQRLTTTCHSDAERIVTMVSYSSSFSLSPRSAPSTLATLTTRLLIALGIVASVCTAQCPIGFVVCCVVCRAIKILASASTSLIEITWCICVRPPVMQLISSPQDRPECIWWLQSVRAWLHLPRRVAEYVWAR